MNINRYLILTIIIATNWFLACTNNSTINRIKIQSDSNIETVACIFNLTETGANMKYGFGSPPLRDLTKDKIYIYAVKLQQHYYCQSNKYS